MSGRMKGTISGLVLGSLLVAGAPALAGAQARGYVGVGGGVSIPMGDFGDAFKLGWLGQVIGGVTFPNGLLGLRANATYGQHKPKEGEGNLKVLGAIGDVVLTPKMEGKAAPYVVGGAGMMQFKNGESDWDLAWNAGGGVRIAAGNLGVYVEARFLQARGNGVTTNMIPITAGVRIGGN